MNTRRAEWAISASGHRGEVLAVEGLSVLDQVASGPMQEHREMEFEVSRVLNLAYNAPCFLLKAEKNDLLPHEVQVYRRS
jgi:hypothetical protein